MNTCSFPNPAGLITLPLLPGVAMATETTSISAAGSAVQVIFGLIAVLGVMMIIAWLFKRYAPGIGQNNSVARIVGGVSVGSRERVLVIEVADRWLVVGVSAGQVNSIANLDAGQATELSNRNMNQGVPATNPFAKWLSQSMSKAVHKPEGK